MEKTAPGLRNELAGFYRTANGYSDRQHAHTEAAYREYIDFIRRFVHADSLLLDLGCATGTSSFLLVREGYKVIGADISDASMRRAKDKMIAGLDFTCADILRLPFKDEAFDCVSLFLVIEHIPDIPALLEEMIRLVKPQGKVIILSPNLLSPFNALVPLWDSARGRRANFLFGVDGFWDVIRLSLRNTFALLRKKFSSSPSFNYRIPVLENRFDFVADNDAVYLSCPLDFKRYFENKDNMRIVNYQGYGKIGRILPDFATGIYFAAKKIAR